MYTQTAAKSASHDYTIYVFPHGSRCWQKQETVQGHRQALRRARSLYASGLHTRVEVKGFYTDPRSGAPVSPTVRIFEKRRWRLLPGVWSLAVGCLVSGAMLAALSLLLHS